MSTPDELSCDVAVVGGGLVGASVALGLANSRLRVVLIESAPPPGGAASWDERCIAINLASQRILEDLGVWSTLRRAAAPITSTHISEQGRFGVARFDAVDAGVDALGYNVPMRRLGETLWQKLVQTRCAQVISPATVAEVDTGADDASLRLSDGRVLSARLVVAADGMHSPLRAAARIEASHRDYRQSAIVTAVRTHRTHRGCAYERFTPDGPIAVLPKPWEAAENLCSLIWTTPTDEVEQRLQWSDAEFLAAAEQAFGERLGRFTELGRRVAHPLHRVVSEQLMAPRTVFVGNAAQSLHPVAAQGFNLGLRDAATLAEVLGSAAAEGIDPGDDDLLRGYGARREGDRRAVSRFTDGIVQVFSNRVPGLRGLRHLGLLAIDLAPPLRDAVLWQNLGFGGQSPGVVRRTS